MGRQLASYDDTTYSYNESGIRTSKTVGENTTEFYLNETNIIYQTDGTNDIYFFYDRNNEIVGFKYSGNNYFYVKNQMGDITDITDENGIIVASYSYDPWGKITSVSGSNLTVANLNPFRYRSYYYDSDIQMYYLQSRYYDPEVGRFINCDDVNYIGLTESNVSYNPFSYCLNNPILNVDEDGYFNLSGIKNTINKVTKTVKWISDLVDNSLKIRVDNRKNVKDGKKVFGKYYISVNFSNKKVKKDWIKVWKSDDCKGVIDSVTEMILDRFKNKYRRQFLFSKECVSNEIYMHLYGYMWSIGKARTCPPKFTGYYIMKRMSKKINGNISRKEFIKKSSEAADIFETDMYLHKEEAEWYGFDYYNGIASCYKKTWRDPYYNSKTKTRERSYLSDTWLYKKI